MLRADSGIIEAGRDRVRFVDLPVLIHQQIGAIAVQHAGPAARERGRVQPGGEPMARRLPPVDLDLRIVQERVEQAHGIGAATDARDQRIRQASFSGHHLLARFVADDRLEVAHHHRVGMRAGHGADAVERICNVGHPIAQRLVHGILERF